MDKELYGTKKKVVKHFISNGFECLIYSMGTHPCCYVFLKEGDPFMDVDSYDDINIPVHGGFTCMFDNAEIFSEVRNLKMLLPNKKVIGWDYAHTGDRTFKPFYVIRDPYNGTEWATKRKLVNEIKGVTKSLVEMKKWRVVYA